MEITLENLLDNTYGYGMSNEDVSLFDVSEAMLLVSEAAEELNVYNCAKSVMESVGMESQAVTMEGKAWDGIKSFFKKIGDAIKKLWAWFKGLFKKSNKKKLDDIKKAMDNFFKKAEGKTGTVEIDGITVDFDNKIFKDIPFATVLIDDDTISSIGFKSIKNNTGMDYLSRFIQKLAMELPTIDSIKDILSNPTKEDIPKLLEYIKLCEDTIGKIDGYFNKLKNLKLPSKDITCDINFDKVNIYATKLEEDTKFVEESMKSMEGKTMNPLQPILNLIESRENELDGEHPDKVEIVKAMKSVCISTGKITALFTNIVKQQMELCTKELSNIQNIMNNIVSKM